MPAEPKTKYRIVCEIGGTTVFLSVECNKPENLVPMVKALKKRFPQRNYSIQGFQQTEKERIAGFVQK
jgi:hypothetical protein